MGLARVLAPLGLLLLAGCAGVEYGERSSLVHTRYATIENFGDGPVTAEQVDGLLEEVAAILNVTLSPGVPRVRIMVTSPGRIAEVYQQVVTVAPHGARARALYLPGASVVLIPYFQRTLLGHELAHYLTEHYLKSTPRRNWERVAYMVEDALSAPRAAARRDPVPDALAARGTGAPSPAPAN